MSCQQLTGVKASLMVRPAQLSITSNTKILCAGILLAASCESLFFAWLVLAENVITLSVAVNVHSHGKGAVNPSSKRFYGPIKQFYKHKAVLQVIGVRMKCLLCGYGDVVEISTSYSTVINYDSASTLIISCLTPFIKHCVTNRCSIALFSLVIGGKMSANVILMRCGPFI